MNIHGHMKVAEEMELHKGFVIQAQKRYLKESIAGINMVIQDYLDWVDGVFDINEIYALIRLETLCKEKRALMKQLESVKNILKPNSSAVTDAMIETAKAYPVENLIDFRRGKAIAFCHEDKTPSMAYLSRKGLAWCPVCGVYYNAIDILMYRDGYSFIAAVKEIGV